MNITAQNCTQHSLGATRLAQDGTSAWKEGIVKEIWIRVLKFFWGIPEYKGKGEDTVECRLCGQVYDIDEDMASCPHERRVK